MITNSTTQKTLHRVKALQQNDNNMKATNKGKTKAKQWARVDKRKEWAGV